jgi:hypothetical protein
MVQTELPTEILMLISAHVEDRGTLFMLVQSSRTLYALTQPHLYRRFGSQSLGWAARCGSRRTAILSLILSDTKINGEENEGQTPLSCAAQHGHADILGQPPSLYA